MEKYAKSMYNIVEARFPQTKCKILELFGIFDVELLQCHHHLFFCVYGKNENSFLAEQLFPEKSVKIIMIDWDQFKSELIDIKKKYQSYLK